MLPLVLVCAVRLEAVDRQGRCGIRTTLGYVHACTTEGLSAYTSVIALSILRVRQRHATRSTIWCCVDTKAESSRNLPVRVRPAREGDDPDGGQPVAAGGPGAGEERPPASSPVERLLVASPQFHLFIYHFKIEGC